MQYYVPGFVAYGIMSACYNVLAIGMVNRREMGLLKRVRLSPVPTWILMAAIFLSSMIIALLQMVILLAVGRFGYSVHGPANVAAFLLTVLVGMLVFTALGMAMSTLIPNVDAAGPAVSVVFFLLVFLSGLYYYIPPNSGSGAVLVVLSRAAPDTGPLRILPRWVDLTVGVARPRGHGHLGRHRCCRHPPPLAVGTASGLRMRRCEQKGAASD